VFPRKFERAFEPVFAKAGLTIHDPRFGAWFGRALHRQSWYEYNGAWRVFLNVPGGSIPGRNPRIRSRDGAEVWP